MSAPEDIFSNLDFSLVDNHVSQRQAYRAAVQGIHVFVEEDGGLHELLDVSAAGCGMKTEGNIYAQGRLLTVRLEVKGRAIIRGLTARVVRSDDGKVACAFQNLTRQQEYGLDKLVLEIQKRIIIQHKAQ